MRSSQGNHYHHHSVANSGYCRLCIRYCSAVLTLVFALPPRAAPDKDIKQIIFEEQHIEGKIRRPQLILITADQRPEFSPMLLQTGASQKNIVDFVDQSIIEASPYAQPFQFDEHDNILYEK